MSTVLAVPCCDIKHTSHKRQFTTHPPSPSDRRARASPGFTVDAGGPELSPALAALIGHTHCKRPQIVKLLWQYIREHDLQDPSDRRNILLDDKMATVFEEPLTMFSINKQLGKHIIGRWWVGVFVCVCAVGVHGHVWWQGVLIQSAVCDT